MKPVENCNERHRKRKAKSSNNTTGSRIASNSQKALQELLQRYPCSDKQMLAQSWRMYMYLRRIFHTLDVTFEKELSNHNLTAAQFTALVTIMFNEGLSMSNLADLCYWNRSTASRITHTLKKKQLIAISAIDGKTSALKVTPKGQNLAVHYMAQDFAEFKHSLMLITGEAADIKDVFQWLKNSVSYLIGGDTTEYIERTCKKFTGATST